MTSPQRPVRRRDALLGLVPVVTLLVCFAIARGVAAPLGLSERVGTISGFVLAVAGFFVSRAILRRGYSQDM